MTSSRCQEEIDLLPFIFTDRGVVNPNDTELVDVLLRERKPFGWREMLYSTVTLSRVNFLKFFLLFIVFLLHLNIYIFSYENAIHEKFRKQE